MSNYFWLREAQFERIKPYFPLSHGVPRVDDRRVVSGIIHVMRNGLRWRHTPVSRFIIFGAPWLTGLFRA
jgi:putative transposase